MVRAWPIFCGVCYIEASGVGALSAFSRGTLGLDLLVSWADGINGGGVSICSWTGFSIGLLCFRLGVPPAVVMVV